MKANDIQFGGDHYKNGGNLQHWDWIAQNFGAGYFVGCATKYVARHRKKNGMEDLNKAGHFVQKLLELKEEGVVFFKMHARVSVAEFAQANGLTDLETKFCDLVAHWNIGNNLTEALTTLDIIKANFRGQEEA